METSEGQEVTPQEDLLTAAFRRSLFIACENGHLKDVQSLMNLLKQGGAAVNQVDDNGETLLHIACRFGHLELVQWLVKELGAAAVNQADNEGRTPLFSALEVGHPIDTHKRRNKPATTIMTMLACSMLKHSCMTSEKKLSEIMPE